MIWDQEECKNFIIGYLQRILQVLFYLWHICLCAWVHPHLNYVNLILWLNSHSVNAGCYFPRRADKTEHGVFPHFVAFLFFNFYGEVASCFIIRVLPKGLDTIFEDIDLTFCFKGKEYIFQNRLASSWIGRCSKTLQCWKNWQLASVFDRNFRWFVRRPTHHQKSRMYTCL